MIDAILKGVGAIAAGVAAWYADKYVKEKTGKHIHEHAVDYVKALWARLKNWARQYLAEHERIQKIYLSAVSIAAAAKRAQNEGLKTVKIKVFGQEANERKSVDLREEKVDLPDIGEVLEQAKKEPILAMRN
jgi:MoxR-like ATPase